MSKKNNEKTSPKHKWIPPPLPPSQKKCTHGFTMTRTAHNTPISIIGVFVVAAENEEKQGLRTAIFRTKKSHYQTNDQFLPLARFKKCVTFVRLLTGACYSTRTSYRRSTTYLYYK